MRPRRLLGLPFVLAASLLAACTGTDAAKHGVSDFRDRMAHGAYAEIYRTASPEFRKVVTEERFQRFMSGLERQLGTWQSSKDPVWNVQRGTAGHLVGLTYESQFSKGPASERFIWRIERGTPVLLGYHVKSSLLAME